MSEQPEMFISYFFCPLCGWRSLTEWHPHAWAMALVNNCPNRQNHHLGFPSFKSLNVYVNTDEDFDGIGVALAMQWLKSYLRDAEDGKEYYRTTDSVSDNAGFQAVKKIIETMYREFGRIEQEYNHAKKGKTTRNPKRKDPTQVPQEK